MSGTRILQLLNCPAPKFSNYWILRYPNSTITKLSGTQILQLPYFQYEILKLLKWPVPKFSNHRFIPYQILHLLNIPVPKFSNYWIVRYPNSLITELSGTQMNCLPILQLPNCPVQTLQLLNCSTNLQLLNCPVPKFSYNRIVRYQILVPNSPITELSGTQILQLPNYPVPNSPITK